VKASVYLKWLIVVLLVAAANALVFATARARFSETSYEVHTPDEIIADTAGFPHRGPVSAPLSIVVYNDPQSRQGAAMDRLLDTLCALRGDRIRVCYKLRPVYVDKARRIRACAALAAYNQNRFVDMLRLLDSASVGRAQEQKRAEIRSEVLACAKELGLDTGRFSRDLDSRQTARRIGEVVAETEAYGIVVYPCVLAGGRLVRGLVPPGTLVDAIDRAVDGPQAGPLGGES
jgi:protein-disulfide isomerase